MKLFSVLVAGSLSQVMAACAIKEGTSTCTTDDCVYVPAVTKRDAVAAKYLCTVKVTTSCKDSATSYDPDAAGQAAIVAKGCSGTKDAASDCTGIDGCQSTPTGEVKAREAADAKCVKKTCPFYAADKATCEKAGCVFTAAEAGTATTYKCTPDAGNTDDAKKKACTDASGGTMMACMMPATGGANCCKAAVDKEGKAQVFKSCKAKEEDKSGAAAVATGAFAAAAAGARWTWSALAALRPASSKIPR